MCNFMREILTVLYNEQRTTCPLEEVEPPLVEEQRKQIKVMKSVKDAILVQFFDQVLCGLVQSTLLDDVTSSDG